MCAARRGRATVIISRTETPASEACESPLFCALSDRGEELHDRWIAALCSRLIHLLDRYNDTRAVGDALPKSNLGFFVARDRADASCELVQNVLVPPERRCAAMLPDRAEASREQIVGVDEGAQRGKKPRCVRWPPQAPRKAFSRPLVKNGARFRLRRAFACGALDPSGISNLGYARCLREHGRPWAGACAREMSGKAPPTRSSNLDSESPLRRVKGSNATAQEW
jgi:hypothetical protein